MSVYLDVKIVLRVFTASSKTLERLFPDVVRDPPSPVECLHYRTSERYNRVCNALRCIADKLLLIPSHLEVHILEDFSGSCR